MLGIFHPLQTEILGRSVTSHTLRIEDCLVRPKGRIVRVLHVEQLALELRGIMSAKRTGNGDAGALGEHGIAIDDDLVEPLLAIDDMLPVPIALAEVGVISDFHLIAGPDPISLSIAVIAQAIVQTQIGTGWCRESVID